MLLVGGLLVTEYPLNDLLTLIVITFRRNRSQLTLRKSATFPCEEALKKKWDDCRNKRLMAARTLKALDLCPEYK